jgi:predicted Zn-dependent protease
LTHDPNSIEAISGLAGVEVASGKPADAAKFVVSEIERNPNSSPLYMLQGQLFLQSKQPALAEAAFSRSAELDPKNVSALVFLGQPHASMTNWTKPSQTFNVPSPSLPRTFSSMSHWAPFTKGPAIGR